MQDHDMTSVSKDKRTVTVHYCGAREWVKVRDGVVVATSEGGLAYGLHAVREAGLALGRVQGVEV